MLQCLSNALTRPRSLRLLRQLIRTWGAGVREKARERRSTRVAAASARLRVRLHGLRQHRQRARGERNLLLLGRRHCVRSRQPGMCDREKQPARTDCIRHGCVVTQRRGRATDGKKNQEGIEGKMFGAAGDDAKCENSKPTPRHPEITTTQPSIVRASIDLATLNVKLPLGTRSSRGHQLFPRG